VNPFTPDGDVFANSFVGIVCAVPMTFSAYRRQRRFAPASSAPAGVRVTLLTRPRTAVFWIQPPIALLDIRAIVSVGARS
jgi:hypothetical protein